MPRSMMRSALIATLLLCAACTGRWGERGSVDVGGADLSGVWEITAYDHYVVQVWRGMLELSQSGAEVTTRMRWVNDTTWQDVEEFPRGRVSGPELYMRGPNTVKMNQWYGQSFNPSRFRLYHQPDGTFKGIWWNSGGTRGQARMVRVKPGELPARFQPQ